MMAYNIKEFDNILWNEIEVSTIASQIKKLQSEAEKYAKSKKLNPGHIIHLGFIKGQPKITEVTEFINLLGIVGDKIHEAVMNKEGSQQQQEAEKIKIKIENQNKIISTSTTVSAITIKFLI